MRFMCSVPGFVLRISPWPARWAPEINGEVSGSYFSAAQAADDAGCRLTGRLLLCGEAGQPAGQGGRFSQNRRELKEYGTFMASP